MIFPRFLSSCVIDSDPITSYTVSFRPGSVIVIAPALQLMENAGKIACCAFGKGTESNFSIFCGQTGGRVEKPTRCDGSN